MLMRPVLQGSAPLERSAPARAGPASEGAREGGEDNHLSISSSLDVTPKALSSTQLLVPSNTGAGPHLHGESG